ncbi:MAG: (2Fe-2S) ferredoxin domain-containing protein [Candidatus Uhrbacteria bacterium]|nr:(2Fe-2S) ferredoxin domain-containing protein [Candidatus Uhrbacteria bacterium]
MRPFEPLAVEKLVLVCTNTRVDKQSCGNDLGTTLRDALKAELKVRAVPIRVVATGCLGQCLSGPTVVIMPDNLWYGDVCIDDVPAIVGKVVELLEKGRERSEEVEHLTTPDHT